MKHIKKKFYLESTVDSVSSNKNYKNVSLVDTTSPDVGEKLREQRKGTVHYVKTDGTTYGAFICNIDGQTSALPIPDPTLVYFDRAYWFLKEIKSRKAELKQKLDFNKNLDETGINQVYHFFSATSGFVIFLFTSIESFVNQRIPEDYQYKLKLTKKTEIFDQNQIYFNVDFDTKVRKILPEVTGLLDYLAKGSANAQHILNLKNFRDEIIHTKPEKEEKNPDLHYDLLLKKSLNFKYEKTLDAVAAFMNYYKKDYITECDCGVED